LSAKLNRSSKSPAIDLRHGRVMLSVAQPGQLFGEVVTPLATADKCSCPIRRRRSENPRDSNGFQGFATVKRWSNDGPITPVRDWESGAFQAGHAGSIPVARSTKLSKTEYRSMACFSQSPTHLGTPADRAPCPRVHKTLCYRRPDPSCRGLSDTARPAGDKRKASSRRRLGVLWNALP
jgi:hypothetical protein